VSANRDWPRDPWPANARLEHSFPDGAASAVHDTQLRENLGRATSTIRAKRQALVAERDDWDDLRQQAKEIKDYALATLAGQLESLEAAVTRAGGVVHWARDAGEANAIVADVARDAGCAEIVKVKSLTTDEIGLNDALAHVGITALETDLAELICQLDDDWSSHILVPAIHKNRREIRDLFAGTLPGVDPALSDQPEALAAVARTHLREKFRTTRMAVSGANFGCADTGTVCVVESEGNGRMCLTLPDVLVTVMGIDKVVPTWQDLGVMLQLLPTSATGERMNPYTTFWTGVHPGDGPQEFHLILLDNGRSRIHADLEMRQTLRCIRCSACLNTCPVYERTGGHAYGSTYPGPIGAVLTPLLVGKPAASLPFASTLCGACYDVCPVMIEIPDLLVRLRARVVSEAGPSLESASMRGMGWVMRSRRRFIAAQRLRGLARLAAGVPGPGRVWSRDRSLPVMPSHTFRRWWRSR
jgi:L-lactate dehydrogenase complex protein LldF